MKRQVLVTGARGKTGREVVSRLLEVPEVAIRAGSSQPGVKPTATIDPVSFDWHDQATWPAAVDGVDAVYLMRPDLPDAPELVAGLVDLNPNAHVVLLSEQGAAQLPPDHWVRQVEDAVIMRATAWTLLRPSWFQQVLTDPRFFRDEIRANRTLSLPSGGAPIAWVDARDIAGVAVAALVAHSDHHGQTYTVTGPEPLGVAAIADELSTRLGHSVGAVDPPLTEALNGLDPWTTDIVANLYHRVWQGGFAELSPDVEEITGSPPRSMQQFIAAHLDHWRA